jgi:hypothetical protein
LNAREGSKRDTPATRKVSNERYTDFLFLILESEQRVRTLQVALG